MISKSESRLTFVSTSGVQPVGSLPLATAETHFSVDSSGFSTGKFKEWKQVKYGNDERWRIWVKLHLICGNPTKIVTAAVSEEEEFRFFVQSLLN